MIKTGLIVMGPGVKSASLDPLHRAARAATCLNRLAPAVARAGAWCIRAAIQMGPPVGDAGVKPVLLKCSQLSHQLEFQLHVCSSVGE